VSREKFGASLTLNWPPKAQNTILAQPDFCGEKQGFGVRSTTGHYAAGRDNSIWKGIISAFGTLHAPATISKSCFRIVLRNKRRANWCFPFIVQFAQFKSQPSFLAPFPSIGHVVGYCAEHTFDFSFADSLIKLFGTEKAKAPKPWMKRTCAAILRSARDKRM
jgi:hypothetical protein